MRAGRLQNGVRTSMVGKGRWLDNTHVVAKECGVDGNGQAEESLDSRRLVVTERSLGFHGGQPAGQGYADVHGNKRYRVCSGIVAGAIYERCDGVDHFGRR